MVLFKEESHINQLSYNFMKEETDNDHSNEPY